jgi:hypothetical protein
MRTLSWLVVIVSLVFAGCESSGDDDFGEGGDTGGPYTLCGYSYEVANAGGKAIGEACSDDSECAYDVCLMPGDAGNFTNSQFGFCSRGCECNDDPASQLTAAEKESQFCIYPNAADGGKDFRYVVPRCGEVTDCPDAAYTECGLPDHGGASNVCQAL